MTNPHELYSKFDQSIWLNSFDRNLTEHGGMNMMILDGVRGVISNPHRYANAILESNVYDDAINEFVQTDKSMDNETLYQWLVTKDARTAADALWPVYDNSDGQDGYVCLELPTEAAYETADTIDAARHLWKRINRENLMVNVPATIQGILATETLIADNINVNVTHLFLPEDYKAVVKAYLRGLAKNPEPERVRSVASFSINELDTFVNQKLDDLGIAEVQVLKNKTAVSMAKIAYQYYKQIAESEAFRSEQKRGAKMQRLMWAGISPVDSEKTNSGKNGSERNKLFYEEQLVCANTTVALEPEVFDEFLLSGQFLHSLDNDIQSAQRIPPVLDSLQISLSSLIPQLREKSIQMLADSRLAVFTALKNKRLQLVKEYSAQI